MMIVFPSPTPMTDLLLVIKISEALCEAVPDVMISLKDVPREFVREYKLYDPQDFDRYKTFDNGSSIRVSTLPF